MIIESLASGSSGNCYKISDGQTALLIECGLPFKKIKEKLNYSTWDLAGCLISHSHGDHSKAVKDVIKAGIDVYTSLGTAEELWIDDSHRFKRLKSKTTTAIRTLRIMPFDVQHDATEPFGFVIDSTMTDDRLLFLTDSFYTKYRIPRVTHLMIECNYDLETLDNNVNDGRLHSSLRNRVRRSHMSLEQVIEFIRANDRSKLKIVYLMHLSNSNSNEELMKRRVQEVTGVPVVVL